MSNSNTGSGASCALRVLLATAVSGAAGFILGSIFVRSPIEPEKEPDMVPIASGPINDVTRVASLPFVKPFGVNLCLSQIVLSEKITSLIMAELCSNHPIGLDVSFLTLIQLITELDSKVYFIGGFLRDLFSGVVSEDMDFVIFSQRPGTCFKPLEEEAKARGWNTYRNKGFIALGSKASKGKFSAAEVSNPLDGDFCCNMLHYDIQSQALFDPSGFGIEDSISKTLRIPCDRADWDTWLSNDSLLGMRLWRYFNFLSRGFTPHTDELREWMVSSTLKYTIEALSESLEVFLRRKVFCTSLETALENERVFRTTIIGEIAIFRGNSTAKDWYNKNVLSKYSRLKKRSIPGLRVALRKLARDV